eukprot:TRINITY_DN12785_c0_g1_i1.p1 TRINITY_DN12785_c0_g1~~TRINITY_DN12785_c0_g1_i1.p1  ORF type:complete len:254 (-),score=24.94 TRINITY_DN12785_c0_g1_i1:16-777(-)
MIPDNFFPYNPPILVPLITVVVYGIVLHAIQTYMDKRPPLALRTALVIHNFFLCAISFIMAAGLFYEVCLTYYYYGFYALYCGSGDHEWDLRMMYWGLWFYWSKYYELLDTVFLALRKKPLTLLHVFHHVLVVTMCWVQIQAEMYFGWITGFLNTGIHVFMYYYFAMQILGYNIWWKKYLTKSQIVQFFIDCFTSIPWLLIYLAGWPCRGEISAWLIANFGGVCLIILFMNFYMKTYTPSDRRGKKDELKKGE